MSILPPSNAFLVLTHFATFLLRVCITSYMNTQLERVNSTGAAWRSHLLRMEWSELLVWWAEEWLWQKYCYWCQATTAIRMVSATRPFRLHNDADLNWFELFFFFFRSSIVRWWKVNVACVSTTMIHNAYVSIGTPIFISFLTQNNFFYFSFDWYVYSRDTSVPIVIT